MKKTPAETEMYVRPVPVGIYVVQWEEVSQFDNTPTVTPGTKSILHLRMEWKETHLTLNT